MPVEITWLVADRVLYVKSIDVVTVKELFEADDQILAALDRTPSPKLHILLDDVEQTAQPGLLEYNKLKSIRHPKIGWVFEFGTNNKMILFVSAAIVQMFRIPYRVVQTREEAIGMLYKADPTLPAIHEAGN